MTEKDTGLRVPQQEQSQEGDARRPDARAPDAPPSYRKAEEDATMALEEERTGEGTGAKAGEYS